MEISALLAPLVTHSPVVYFCYRPADGHVLYVSPAYEQLFSGHATTVNEELPVWLAALHPDDRAYLREQMALAATGKTVHDVLVRLARPDGGTRWLSLLATGFVPADSTDALISGQLTDVTAIQAVLDNAQRYQAKKDSMLEILSHDLAGPLAMLQQMADYFTEKAAPLADAELNRMLHIMRQTCRDGVTLIQDFVGQEFLDSVNVDLRLTRIDLAERLRLVVDNYQQRQQVAGHLFTFEASHPSIYANIDENKFLQVINNLLGNALKLTPDGGQLSVTITQAPTHLVVTVADNGIGIPTALQPSLFERFTPARRTGLRGEKSTGLGMSIIKTIINLHHGCIWVESQEGQGTTFFIHLPLLQGAVRT